MRLHRQLPDGGSQPRLVVEEAIIKMESVLTYCAIHWHCVKCCCATACHIDIVTVAVGVHLMAPVELVEDGNRTVVGKAVLMVEMPVVLLLP